MRKSIISLLIALFTTSIAFAQSKSSFPLMEVENLKDKVMNIPNDCKGKMTIIGLAYSKKSDDLLKQWYQPFYDTFLAKPTGNELFPKDVYDVNMYFVGMIRGINKTASGKIEKAMKKNVIPEMHKNVTLYRGGIKDYKKPLGLDGKDLPYFYVLDKNGKIVYQTSGAYNKRKFNEILEILDQE
ncbi:hypothetical protein [Sediminitomix flava]|nr:hypothetical protein [Sediminitomix flava]